MLHYKISRRRTLDKEAGVFLRLVARQEKSRYLAE